MSLRTTTTHSLPATSCRNVPHEPCRPSRARNTPAPSLLQHVAIPVQCSCAQARRLSVHHGDQNTPASRRVGSGLCRRDVKKVVEARACSELEREESKMSTPDTMATLSDRGGDVAAAHGRVDSADDVGRAAADPSAVKR